VKPFTALASSLLLATVALSAQSPGIVIVQQETRDGKVTTTQVQIDKTHMRTEAGGTVMVFDGGAQVARIINMDRKTYTELTKAMMDDVSKQMGQMMEQLKNMPPEQRAMMEKMMARGGRGMPGMAAPAPITYRASGSDKVSRWTCAKYDGTRAQQKVVELCTVEPDALGLSVADFEVTKQLAEFLKGLMPQMADQMAVIGTMAAQGYSGYPIRHTSFSNGQATIANGQKIGLLRSELRGCSISWVSTVSAPPSDVNSPALLYAEGGVPGGGAPLA